MRYLSKKKKVLFFLFSCGFVRRKPTHLLRVLQRMEEESVQSANSHKFSIDQNRGAFLHFKGNSAFAVASKEEKEVSADLSLSTESKPNCGAQSSSPVQSGTQSQQPQRKARRCWSPELHRRFVNALQQLGGAQGNFITNAVIQIIFSE